MFTFMDIICTSITVLVIFVTNARSRVLYPQVLFTFNLKNTVYSVRNLYTLYIPRLVQISFVMNRSFSFVNVLNRRAAADQRIARMPLLNYH